MQTNLSLPIMFRGRTKRQKLDRDMYVHATKSLSVDVPEISSSETSLASLQITRKESTSYGEYIPSLRLFNGDLYRPISNIDDKPRIGLYKDYTEVSLSHPLYSHIFWKDKAFDLLWGKNRNVWPKNSYGYGYLSNSIDFTDAMTKLRSYNSDDIAEFDKMHDAQVGKLLYIDGEPWIKTTPPCVTVFARHNSDDRNQGRNVVMKNGYYPDFQDLDFGVTRFSLLNYEDAYTYASEIAKNGDYEDIRMDSSNPRDQILIPDAFEIDDNTLEEDELFRFSFVLASNLVKSSERHKVNYGYVQFTNDRHFSDDEKIAFEKIKDELFKCNAVLSQRGDLPKLTPEIVNLWKKNRSMVYDNYIGVAHSVFSELFSETYDRANKILDDMPINIASNSHFQL